MSIDQKGSPAFPFDSPSLIILLACVKISKDFYICGELPSGNDASVGLVAQQSF